MSWRKVLLAASPSIALLAVTVVWNAWERRGSLLDRLRI